MTCPQCGQAVLDIDVKCGHCGAPLGSTGAHRMLGQVMLGHYELVDVLGQGGMSVVFKGRHQLTEQEVALKILPPELAAHSQVKSRFLEEAKALAALDHPNIVHLYNFGQEGASFVLAMQYVAGQTWERLILARSRLDWQTSCRICLDVLRALEYAHGRGVIHRDMKPSNVLVRDDTGAATVMDFGIAKMTTSTKLTATGQTMGTVRYMSPEQVRGQEVDARTDLYSLGATLYESLTGETPFDGSTHFEIMTKHLSDPPRAPSARGVELPARVDDAVMRCLAKRPADRFGSARELRQLLEAVLRETDLGLVETQRMNRDLLGAIPTARSAPERVATANDLADQLEPSASAARPRPRRRRSVVPWLVLGALVAAIGVVTTLIVLDKTGSAGPAPSDGPFPGLALQPARQVGELRVVTDGTVSADRVVAAYRAERARVQRELDAQLAARHKPAVALPDHVRELFAVPQAALCVKSAYIVAPPEDCGSVAFAVTIGDRSERGRQRTEPRLYLVSSRLAEAVQGGVAQVVCDYLPQGPDKLEICDLVAGREPP